MSHKRLTTICKPSILQPFQQEINSVVWRMFPWSCSTKLIRFLAHILPFSSLPPSSALAGFPVVMNSPTESSLGREGLILSHGWQSVIQGSQGKHSIQRLVTNLLSYLSSRAQVASLGVALSMVWAGPSQTNYQARKHPTAVPTGPSNGSSFSVEFPLLLCVKLTTETAITPN